MTSVFQRDFLLNKVKSKTSWDVIVIGGGASGLGIALDAANRGYSTLLLEQSDIAKGTSSRSTKLIHGGVRYLANGDLRLVYDALHERGILQHNAAHLVKKQSFVIPCYTLLSKIKYYFGLKLYDLLSGSYSLGKSEALSHDEVTRLFPGLKAEGLVGGVKYYDAQFDDARLAVNLAQTCVEQGGVVLNYFEVTGLVKKDRRIQGVTAKDIETGKEYTFLSKVVVNATGVFVDNILRMDVPEKKPMVKPSQGIHIVIKRSFLNGECALMIPETADGRVLFAIPWQEHILVGTTDTPIDEYSMEPQALDKEVKFILDTIKQYLKHPPGEEDILSVFAGLRPLAAPADNLVKTKEISRSHKLFVSDSGLVTITGGKWTTYRKMAEDTVKKIIEVGKLPKVECNTKNLKICGSTEIYTNSHLNVYGDKEKNILELVKELPFLEKKLITTLPYMEAEVVWAVRFEMARTVEDVLARRLRILFLDAKAAIEAAPRVAELLQMELNYDENWKSNQIIQFNKVAANYLRQTENYILHQN
ncbi:glycerol-3-phosphate dehydrogenase/oxidase [Segetibacter koreensis]|uniref:glycerol-3-phosphate dehydrogenase/oxidase n=1 Tax=Segetibacter koreensis TaxID=398037 RepID=UPI000362B197|nr:glycerol-3-phosphate dehydrogenase/oxidase [Segetibacter koreensis]